MLRRDEISASLAAAARLFAQDPSGMRGFDLSVDGFFRSFRAIVLILPLLPIVLIAERQMILAGRGMDPAAFPDVAFVVWRVLFVAIDWVSLPLLMLVILRDMRLGGRYVAFVVAHNWSQVLSAALLSIPWLAYGLGIIGATGAFFVQLVLIVVWARYAWFVAKTSLGTTGVVAAGIVVLEFATGLLIDRLGMRVLGF